MFKKGGGGGGIMFEEQRSAWVAVLLFRHIDRTE